MPRRRIAVAVAAVAVIALALVLMVGERSRVVVRTREVSPVEVVGGVPVGVERSPAGALAAAERYVSVSAQTLEQDPRVFARLVGEVYAPAVRERVLEEAREIRSTDTVDMANYARGGRGLAVIAAQQLVSFTPAAASVRCWLEGIVWGPRFAPRQTWSLVNTTLSWSAGRWLVLDSHLDAAPAPVPAVVYVQGANDTSAAFARLAQMSSLSLGAGG